MKPNGYQITTTVPGFERGDILNVTERYRHWHRDEMALEQITSSPGSRTVIVTEELTGFSEGDVLDETSRFGDWHTYSRIFDGGREPLEVAVRTDGPVRITTETLAHIADPITATAPSPGEAETNQG